MVDIREVAAQADVSTATVSRVLSGGVPVREDKRRRVLRVVDRLQYVPSAPARSLRKARSMLLGVVVPDLANPVFLPLLRGVHAVGQANGYSVVVVDAQRSDAVERLALERLVAQRIDGLLLVGSTRTPDRIPGLERQGLVVVDATARGGPWQDVMATLERPGILAACDTLAELGHQSLAYVTRRGAPGEAGQRRWSIVQRRCAQLHVKARHLSLEGDRSPAELRAALRSGLRRSGPITALLSSSHGLAPDLLRSLRAAGIDLPGDCSLVTFGDSEWAEAYRPGISTITMDLYEVSRIVTTKLVERLAAVRTSRANLELRADEVPHRTVFVRRGSVGPPPP